MLGVAARFWNEVAHRARCPAWRRLLSLDAGGQSAERERWFAAMLAAGVDESVAGAYLEVGLLLHEATAISHLRKRYPQYAAAWPRVKSPGAAVELILNDRILDPRQAAALARMLADRPEGHLPPVSPAAQRDEWYLQLEHEPSYGSGGWNVATSVEPSETEARLMQEMCDDPDFDDACQHWAEWAWDPDDWRAVALEQCFDDAELLGPSARAARLAGAPDGLRADVEAFWLKVPLHVAVRVGTDAYWVVRTERGRQTGDPDWSPLYPMAAIGASATP